MRWWFLVLLLIASAKQLTAQTDSAAVGVGSVTESSTWIQPELRHFDRSAIEQLRAENDYDQDIRRVPTLWERFKEWLGEWLERFFGSNFGSSITDNLIYVIIGVALFFAIIMLSRGGVQRMFQGAPRSLGEVAVSEEDIREMDLSSLIEEAERSSDLRRAIRLHYLLVLRRLVDRQILEWHPYFTDQEYMAQIKDPTLRSRFAHVALVFQWVWYGNAQIAAEDYHDLRRPFIEFETAPAV